MAPRRTATFRLDRDQADLLVKALRGAIYMEPVSREAATYLSDVLAAHLHAPTDELTVKVNTAYAKDTDHA